MKYVYQLCLTVLIAHRLLAFTILSKVDGIVTRQEPDAPPPGLVGSGREKRDMSEATGELADISRGCPLDSDTSGDCVDHCRSDRDCQANLICCPNGCGHTCQRKSTVGRKQVRRGVFVDIEPPTTTVPVEGS